MLKITSILVYVWFLFSINVYAFSSPKSYTLRNNNGSYTGRVVPFGNRANIYGPNGRYGGYYQSYGNSTRVYSNNGRYIGRINPALKW